MTLPVIADMRVRAVDAPLDPPLRNSLNVRHPHHWTEDRRQETAVEQQLEAPAERQPSETGTGHRRNGD